MTTETTDEGVRFYNLAGEPPIEPWAYELDDFGIRYTKAHLWPFARTDEEESRRNLVGSVERSMTRAGREFTPPARGTGMTSVRLAPDTEYRSWGSEYVTAFPSWWEPHLANASLDLFDRKQGMGSMVATCSITLDLAAGTFAIGKRPTFPERLRDQAGAKAAKLLAFFQAAMAERDRGKRRPATAYDRWARTQR